MASPTASRK